MDCRFPGGADDPDRFWRLLCDGFDAVGEFPPGRLDDAGARDRATTKWGAFLDGVDRFDAAFFHISPREAARSEEHTSELQSLMRISYAVFCLKKKILLHIVALIPTKTEQ